MVFDWVLLFAGLGSSVYVFTNARELAARPRRGTAWKPSYRTYLLLAGACLLIAVGAVIDIVSA
jgi:hypothetical protein